MDELELAKKLITFPSITPKQEGCIDFIADFLRMAGFKILVKTFGEGDDLVTNLYAEYGTSGPNICFAGHIDVVPTGNHDLWLSHPFKPEIRDGLLFGRGAADMKGAIAASIIAAVDYIKDHKFAGKVSFLLTSDEEVGRKEGFPMMLEWLDSQGCKFDFAIFGEPTAKEKFGDQIKIGARGSVNFVLEVQGVQGHVAYQESTVNPIDIMAKIINEFTSMELDKGNQFFQVSNLEMTTVDVGNKATNVVPAKCNAKFNIRFNDIHTPDTLAKKIEKIVQKYSSMYKLEYDCPSQVFIVQPSLYHEQFAAAVNKVCNVNPILTTNGATSDGRFMKDYCDLLEFGAFTDQAHQINESIAIRDLQSLKNVYYLALCNFFQ